MPSSQITDFTPFLSIISQRRTPNVTSVNNNFPNNSLADGCPNNHTFPFQSLNVELKHKAANIEIKDFGDSPREGLNSLTNVLRKHQQETHDLPMDENEEIWDIVCTSGSQDGLAKVFEMLLNPYVVQLQGFQTSQNVDCNCLESIRDAIIIERPSYVGTLNTLSTFNPMIIEVEIDRHGIIPELLEESIKQFKKQHPKTRIKFLYTIPNGHNPTGCSQTFERKQKIYQIAQKYNFLILEDDPNYYLNLYDIKDTEMMGNIERVPSYLSIDTDARVLRFDSFSKILSSGIRLGYITGPTQLIQQISLHLQATDLHSYSLSQTIVCSLLNHWGKEGFSSHIEMIQKFYTGKRNDFIDSINSHLGDLVEFDTPVCGMVIWLKLNGIIDSLKFIEQQAREHKVLLLPGTYFYATNSTTNYVRACFSIASKEEMDEACKRLAVLLKEEQ